MKEESKNTTIYPIANSTYFPQEETDQSIPDRFRTIVSKHADRPAIIKDSEHFLTYDGLNRKANRIAQTILATRGQKPEPIGLLFDHSCDFVAAIFGILKAGKFYVPLDPLEPTSRVQSMLEDSQASVVLTNGSALSYASAFVNPNRLLIIDEIGTSASDQNPAISIDPDSIAYIMYTSGSTGKPKAVMQNHRNLLQQTLIYTNALHISSEDRMSLLHSCSNGACTPHLFGSLLNGAALYPFDAKQNGLSQLARYLTAEAITIYHSIPALFRSLAHSLSGAEDFSNIRIVHLSGDAATREDLELYKKNFSPTCLFVHRLGSREANTVFMYLIDKSFESVGNALPVGPAVDGKEVTLVDEYGVPVANGEVGEIVITSRYLSPGYWRDPERTKSVFRMHRGSNGLRSFQTGDLGRRRSDGNFEFLGRKDSRVKIRGYRVELAEIEMALLSLGVLKEAAVLARDTSATEKELVAYVVPMMRDQPSSGDLRRLLGSKLPEYMIPSRFVFLDSLPLQPNGKINRRVLVSLEVQRAVETSYVPPSTPIEAELALIWAEILSIDKIGVNDEFLELGGHSLAATQIVSRVLKKFRLEIPLQSLFQAPTIARMAEIIREKQVKQLDMSYLDSLLSELEGFSDEDAKKVFEYHLAAKHNKS
jgi:amino acid adenylation domain-containing protein